MLYEKIDFEKSIKKDQTKKLADYKRTMSSYQYYKNITFKHII